VFFDGQNLFHSAKAAFGYTYPNFDPVKLANYVTQKEGGSEKAVYFGREKGIDVRIAIDVLKMARNNQYDVAVVFSQDQDLYDRCLDP
jgi:hypothetical protein